MKRRVVLALALACLVPAAALAQEGSAAIQSHTLRNGLRVLLVPDASAGGVDVAVWYGAGPRFERPGQRGFSHVIERLQFRGAAGVGDGEHRRQLLAAGGTLNTNSASDYSCLWQTVPPEALDLALRLEAARMGSLALDPRAIEQERRATLEERRRLMERQPIARGLLRVMSLLFPAHPYGTGLLGDEADLQKATARDLEAWARERFAPGNATLSVVGRFDPDATLEAIRRHFEGLPRRASATSRAIPEPAPLARARATVSVDAAGALLVVGWRGPAATDPDAPAGELLARLLHGGADARLAQALQTEGSGVASVQAAWDQRRDASVLWAAAALRPGADSARVEQDMLATVRRLASQGPDGAELDRARKRLLTTTMFAMQGPRGRAAALGEALALAGDPGAAQKRLDALRRVTPADVQRVAQRVVRDERMAIVWLRGTDRTEGSR